MDNTRTYRDYTDEDIIKYSAEVCSMSALLVKLGLKPAGGNYALMKKKLQALQLDCQHWSGQAWNKNERLKDWSQYTRTTIKMLQLSRFNSYLAWKKS